MVYTKQQKRSRKTRATSVYIPGHDLSIGKGESLKSHIKKQSKQSPFMNMLDKLFGRKV